MSANQRDLLRALPVAAVSIAAFSLCQFWPATMEFGRAEIRHGEAWRLLTCHLVHMSWTHMSFNVAGFLICLTLLTRSGKGAIHLAAVLAYLGLCVSLPTLFLNPEIEHYRGFSGVLYGLAVLAIAVGLRERPVIRYAALTALVLKIVNDIFGLVPALQAERYWNFDVFTYAHLYGVLGALVLCVASWIFANRSQEVQPRGRSR